MTAMGEAHENHTKEHRLWGQGLGPEWGEDTREQGCHVDGNDRCAVHGAERRPAELGPAGRSKRRPRRAPWKGEVPDDERGEKQDTPARQAHLCGDGQRAT